MKILTLNVDSVPFHQYITNMTDGKGQEILFIDWVSTTTDSDHTKPLKQIQIVESTPLDILIVVFDRHCSMTKEEINFFVGRKAILLRPELVSREPFIFMPYYVDNIDLPLSVWDEPRLFYTGVKGVDNTAESESYILPTLKHNKGDESMGIDVDSITSQNDFDSLQSILTIGDFRWDQFESTVVVGTESDYSRGVLPDITNHLKYGVIPLISHKYKYFHSLFNHFIMVDHELILWYKKLYKTCNYGFIEELYKNITLYMPEMLTENFVQTLIGMI